MGLDIFFEKHSEIGYFRKVNFLVAYFEDLGFDVEHQIPFWIKKDHIIALINRCKTVLDDHSKAPEELPTCEGFFFGSTEYDEGYFYDVEMVLHYCEETLLPMFDELNDSEGIYFTTWY
jgi:hypothetical protein